MKRARKILLLSLMSSSARQSILPVHTASSSSSSPLRSLSTTNNSNNPNLPRDRDSLILQHFRRRQQKGSAADEVPGFEALGLRKELVEAAAKMGVFAPNEIHSVGIPAVLAGKSIVLSSEAESPRTLAYLLPLVQLLRRNEASGGISPQHPRAIVLCTTEEMSDECFQMGKFISDHTQSKSSTNDHSSGSQCPTTLTTPPLGVLVGTPSEVLEQIEEAHALCDEVKYLILDEADDMLRRSFGPVIQKILSRIPDLVGIQKILVTSPASEMLGKQAHPVMERLGENHAGEVAAMLLDMDKMEVLDLVASVDALKSKVREAMDSLCSGVRGS